MHQDLPARRSTLPTISADVLSARVGHDRAGFQLGHVEQIGDEAVRRSDLVDHGGEQIVLFGLGEPAGEIRMVLAAPSTEASGVLRSCEIEVNSAERSRSDSTVRLTRSISSTSSTRSMASAP